MGIVGIRIVCGLLAIYGVWNSVNLIKLAIEFLKTSKDLTGKINSVIASIIIVIVTIIIGYVALFGPMPWM